MVSTMKFYNAKIDIIGLKNALTTISSIGLILGQYIANECVFWLK